MNVIFCVAISAPRVALTPQALGYALLLSPGTTEALIHDGRHDGLAPPFQLPPPVGEG